MDCKLISRIRMLFQRIRGFIERSFYKPCWDSDIEFYLVDAFEIYHFLPFYQAFRECGLKAVFIDEPASIHVSGSYFNYTEAESILTSVWGGWSTITGQTNTLNLHSRHKACIV